MSIDFGSLLSAEQKKEILNQRLQQFAAEAYQHKINKDLAQKINNEQGVLQAEQALVLLEEAIKFHQEEIAKL